jgi:uncharacterized membrane protein
MSMSKRFYHQSILRRFARHLYYEARGVAPVFSAIALKRIEQAVTASELTHTAEIRIAVEASLTLRELCHGKSPRARALEAFSLLKVWDTEENNGVLIYINVADRAVEIVADRGIHRVTPETYWHTLCAAMIQGFQRDAFEPSVIECVNHLSTEFAKHFPANELSKQANLDELPNAPAVL